MADASVILKAYKEKKPEIVVLVPHIIRCYRGTDLYRALAVMSMLHIHVPNNMGMYVCVICVLVCGAVSDCADVICDYHVAHTERQENGGVDFMRATSHSSSFSHESKTLVYHPEPTPFSLYDMMDEHSMYEHSIVERLLVRPSITCAADFLGRYYHEPMRKFRQAVCDINQCEEGNAHVDTYAPCS